MIKIFIKIFILINILHFSNAFAEDYHYYVIADAGSSGTRLHLFKHNNIKKMPVIEDVFSVKNNTPLSSFEEHSDQAYESLKPLLEDMIKKIHDNHIKTPVPISILGTAGMRMLTSEQQHTIYNYIKNDITNDYKDILIPENIQTISGKMEGVYGWLDVNYLLKNFQNNNPTSGSIDIGGASTEIAFATEKSSKPIDETSITLNNINYIIFSKSFLGLGIDQARTSMNVDENSNHCYPKNYNMPPQKGSFNLASCSMIYNQVIDNYHINQLKLPTYNVPTFIAFSGAYHTFHFFEADPKIPDQDTLEQTIILPTCSNSWETLKEAYPAEPESYLANYCGNSIFLTNLFYGAFQLQYQQINIVSKINESKIDWTLGAMLYTIIKSDT